MVIPIRKITYVAIPLLLLCALLAAVMLPRQISLWKDGKEQDTIYVKTISEEKTKSLSFTGKMRLLWDMKSTPDARGRKEAQTVSAETDAALFEEMEKKFYDELAVWQDGGMLPDTIEPRAFACTEGRVVRYYDTANQLRMTTYELYAEDPQGNGALMVLDGETGRGLQAEIRLAQAEFPAATPEAVGEWYFDSLQVSVESRPVSEDTTWFAIGEVNLVYLITVEHAPQTITVSPVGLMSQVWQQDESDATLMEKGS